MIVDVDLVGIELEWHDVDPHPPFEQQAPNALGDAGFDERVESAVPGGADTRHIDVLDGIRVVVPERPVGPIVELARVEVERGHPPFQAATRAQLEGLEVQAPEDFRVQHVAGLHLPERVLPVSDRPARQEQVPPAEFGLDPDPHARELVTRPERVAVPLCEAAIAEDVALPVGQPHLEVGSTPARLGRFP